MDTLEFERARLIQDRETGTHCNACGQFVKLYARQIHSTIARALLFAYDISREGQEVFHVNDVFHHVANVYGDFQKAKLWGLIETVEDGEFNGSKSSGKWRFTPKGTAFVLEQITIPKYVYLYNGKPFGFGGGDVTIRQCLGKRFNYHELMNRRLTNVTAL